MRINGNRTSANDDVPGFESLGEGAASARASAEAVNRVLRMMMLRLLECDWGHGREWALGLLIQLNESRVASCDVMPGLLCVNSQMIMFLF